MRASVSPAAMACASWGVRACTWAASSSVSSAAKRWWVQRWNTRKFSEKAAAVSYTHLDVYKRHADAFLAALATHCGQAFAGRIISNEPKPTTPDSFEGKPLVMHVRGCENPNQGLRVPFHVGADHSRTWVLTRTAEGLRLKHDHRHEDGSEDELTQYGGDTATPGTAQRQELSLIHI